jgi:hypothetical protein
MAYHTDAKSEASPGVRGQEKVNGCLSLPLTKQKKSSPPLDNYKYVPVLPSPLSPLGPLPPLPKSLPPDDDSSSSNSSTESSDTDSGEHTLHDDQLAEASVPPTGEVKGRVTCKNVDNVVTSVKTTVTKPTSSSNVVVPEDLADTSDETDKDSDDNDDYEDDESNGNAAVTQKYSVSEAAGGRITAASQMTSLPTDI